MTTVKQVDVLDGQLLEEAWALYRDAFQELRELAAQRHQMYRDEFDDVMADKRVPKFVAYDDDQDSRLVGLSTYTNDLDAMPLISPAFFAKRWPTEYAAGRIWYVGFVAVGQNMGAPLSTFADLLAAMHAVSGRDALTALDVCSRMDGIRRLPKRVEQLLDHLDGPVRARRLDEQSFWLYEFLPLPG